MALIFRTVVVRPVGRYGLVSLAHLSILLLLACSVVVDPIHVGASDEEIVSGIKRNGNHFESAHSRIWYLENELTRRQARGFAQDVEVAILDIRAVLLTGLEDVRATNRIEYILSSQIRVAHARPDLVFVPTSQVAEHRAPYLHETAHVLSEQLVPLRMPNPNMPNNERPLWLIEGLASYIDQIVSEQRIRRRRPSSSMSRRLDSQTALGLRTHEGQRLLQYVGTYGTPSGPGTEPGDLFYAQSHSFVRYLVSRIGLKRVMQLYAKRGDTRGTFLKEFEEITFRPTSAWQQEWLQSMSARQERF
jgi:hypothetical protein